MTHQMNYEIAKRRQDVRMLCFGFRRGAYLSLPYLKLHSAYFENKIIILVFRDHIVRVCGEKLDKIYRAIDSQNLVSLNETINEKKNSLDGERIDAIHVFEEKTNQHQI